MLIAHSQVDQESISNTNSGVESLLFVLLESVDFLYQEDHMLSGLVGHLHRLCGVLGVVSDGELVVYRGVVGTLAVERSELPFLGVLPFLILQV